MQALLEQDKTLMTIGCVLYAMAFLPVLASLIRKREYPRCLFLAFLLLGFLFQSLGLYLRGAAIHDFPVQNTFEVFQVIAWLAIAMNFIVRLMFRLQLLNFFASGMALLCSAVSLCVPGWDSKQVVSNIAGNPWVNFHAALAVASYAVFSVLALTSVMYLIQDRALSRRKSGNLSLRLPAIGQLEAVNTKLITLGVSLLTIAMGVGALNMWEDSANVRGIKLAIACTVWIGYLIILVLRRRRHLVGRPFARACLTVFLYALCLLWPLTYRPPLPQLQPSPHLPQEAAPLGVPAVDKTGSTSLTDSTSLTGSTGLTDNTSRAEQTGKTDTTGGDYAAAAARFENGGFTRQISSHAGPSIESKRLLKPSADFSPAGPAQRLSLCTLLRVPDSSRASLHG